MPEATVGPTNTHRRSVVQACLLGLAGGGSAGLGAVDALADGVRIEITRGQQVGGPVLKRATGDAVPPAAEAVPSAAARRAVLAWDERLWRAMPG